MTMKQILKYPRTPHLRGSTLQQDDDPEQVSMASLKGRKSSPAATRRSAASWTTGRKLS